ncbi:TetR/AcrR family transcriptional regulator [Shouchella patagoniensis]|uniref:TetR/AcrR family transcriptional regulator n=1 Tax=Shouchella patagoniensis TaxID=228576 RepID=UPI0009955E4B|nr:TetR/AcrR family transcriptional regulator [Shouchella patagoniensis]
MHTKEKILAESMELFAVNGYEGTSMAKIAEKVGIKKPSLYAHYKSKEALFIDINKKMADEYVEFVKTSLESESNNIETLLFNSMKIHLQDLAQNDTSLQFYNRFIQYPPQGLEEQLATSAEESDKQARAIVEEVIARGQEANEITNELDAANIAHTYFYLIDGLANETTFYTLEEVERHLETVWAVYWRGIKA